MKSLCLNKYVLLKYNIDSLIFMQNLKKVPFKLPEIFSHTLGGGLEIWASIHRLLSKSLLCLNKITYFYSEENI